MKGTVFFLPLLISSLFTFAHAEGKPWKISLNANLTSTMNTYSDNWIGGDAGAVSWLAQINGTADKIISDKVISKNSLHLSFGEALAQNKKTKLWAAPQKTTDLIDIGSVLQFTLGSFVDPYIAVRALSLFMDGSDSLLVRYGNPWDITESFGAARSLVKNDRVEWSSRLGGAARQLVDRNKLNLVSQVRKTDVTSDGGFEFISDLKTATKDKKVSFSSLLKLYEAVLSSKADAWKDTKDTLSKDDWKYPHVNWENVLTLSFTKYIMVNGYIQLLYDKEMQENVRFKQTYGIGLTYSFNSK